MSDIKISTKIQKIRRIKYNITIIFIFNRKAKQKFLRRSKLHVKLRLVERSGVHRHHFSASVHPCFKCNRSCTESEGWERGCCWWVIAWFTLLTRQKHQLSCTVLWPQQPALPNDHSFLINMTSVLWVKLWYCIDSPYGDCG